MLEIVQNLPTQTKYITSDQVNKRGGIIAIVTDNQVSIITQYNGDKSGGNKYCFASLCNRDSVSSANHTVQQVIDLNLRCNHNNYCKLYYFETAKEFAQAILNNNWT